MNWKKSKPFWMFTYSMGQTWPKIWLDVCQTCLCSLVCRWRHGRRWVGSFITLSKSVPCTESLFLYLTLHSLHRGVRRSTRRPCCPRAGLPRSCWRFGRRGRIWRKLNHGFMIEWEKKHHIFPHNKIMAQPQIKLPFEIIQHTNCIE